MKELFKKMIIERQEWLKKIDLFERDIKIESHANYVFTGLRRAGKSYFLYQIIKKNNLDKDFERVLFINFEDERLLEITSDDLQLIIDAYFELYNQEPVIFLDELQNVPNWQKFVRRLADEGKRVFVTGSNAAMLSHEIASTLGGRFINKEILPLSFREFLTFKSFEISDKIKYSADRFKVIQYYDEYLHFGGFPELLRMDYKREFLSSVYQKLFYGDLITRYKISNVSALKLLVKKMAESVNNETSILRIRNLIKSTGLTVGNNTLYEYIIYLDSSFLISSVSNYQQKFSEKESIKKYYFLDTGLLGLFLTDQPTKLLENQVYIELRRRNARIFYLKRKLEVDFYLPDEQKLIQVSYSISNPETADREVSALRSAMKEFAISSALIITHNETDSIRVDEGSINVVPAWQWLLDLDKS
jgi:predicted AAA+ superfamily ATPase